MQVGGRVGYRVTSSHVSGYSVAMFQTVLELVGRGVGGGMVWRGVACG